KEDTVLKLISHELCPDVQRAVIALTEKGVPFERIDVDLADKPDWFKAMSPLGKTPVVLVPVPEKWASVFREGHALNEIVGGTAIFESAVILEFLEETRPEPAASRRPARARGASRLDRVRLRGAERRRRALRGGRRSRVRHQMRSAARQVHQTRGQTRAGTVVCGRTLPPGRCGVRAGVPLFRRVRP